MKGRPSEQDREYKTQLNGVRSIEATFAVEGERTFPGTGGIVVIASLDTLQYLVKFFNFFYIGQSLGCTYISTDVRMS